MAAVGEEARSEGIRELGSGEAVSVLVAGLSSRGTTWQTRAVGDGSMAVFARVGKRGRKREWRAGLGLGRAARQVAEHNHGPSLVGAGERWGGIGWARGSGRGRDRRIAGVLGRGALLQKMTHRAWGTCNTRRPNPGGLAGSANREYTPCLALPCACERK